ncbi:MAG: type I DNA topoisomerase, partial [bacterium]|nr:type I DNA topoisomerase [bacterium]
CSAEAKAHKTRKILADGQTAAAPEPTGIACARKGCEGELVTRRSRRTGKIFYGCSQFPKCNYVVWDTPILQPCPACEHPHLTLKTTKKDGTRLVCPNKSCSHSEEAPKELIASLENGRTHEAVPAAEQEA